MNRRLIASVVHGDLNAERARYYDKKKVANESELSLREKTITIREECIALMQAESAKIREALRRIDEEDTWEAEEAAREKEKMAARARRRVEAEKREKAEAEKREKEAAEAAIAEDLAREHGRRRAIEITRWRRVRAENSRRFGDWVEIHGGEALPIEASRRPTRWGSAPPGKSSLYYPPAASCALVAGEVCEYPDLEDDEDWDWRGRGSWDVDYENWVARAHLRSRQARWRLRF